MSSRANLSSGERKLRYRELISAVADIDEGAGANAETVCRVSEVVGESARLLAEADEEQHAKHPAEGLLDSQLLRATSNIVIRCSEAVSGNVNTYDADELAQSIRNDPAMWSFELPLSVPIMGYLHGAFDPTPPEERQRAQRRRVERQQVGQLKEPEAVNRLDKTEEGAEMMSRVNRLVSRRHKEGGGRPISYFHLVLDPGSFSRTIENIYYVSFLARDGLLSVQIDETTGLPAVTPLPQSQKESDERTGVEEKQFIVSMDVPRWRKYLQAFRIERPMMSIKRG